MHERIWRCAPPENAHAHTCRIVPAEMLTLLRIWVGLVAAMAVVNAVNCFLDQEYPKTRIYDLQPLEGVQVACTNSSIYCMALYMHLTCLNSHQSSVKDVWSVDTAGFCDQNRIRYFAT